MAFTKTGFSTGQITGEALSADVTTEGFILGQKPVLSIQVVISNTDSVGELYVQASNDGTNYINVAFKDNNDTTQSSFSVASATDVNQGFVIYPAAFSYYRLFYDRTSGGSSDTMAAYALGKKFF